MKAKMFTKTQADAGGVRILNKKSFTWANEEGCKSEGKGGRKE
jgi:hypothetical protein